MRRYLYCGFSAFALTAGLIFAQDVEYTVTPATYLLLHGNGGVQADGQGAQAKAALFGAARLVDNGRFGGALDPGTDGGVEIQADQMLNSQYGFVSLEAWIFLREYPKDRAYIIDKVYEAKNSQVIHNRNPEEAALGLTLFIDAKGRIGYEIISLYYGPTHKRLLYSPEPYQVPLNRWVHVAVSNAAWPVGKLLMFADCKPILKLNHEYQYRIFYDGERETKPGRTIIGNNAAKTAPFPGLLDEVRILRSNLDLQPPADLSWTDPEAKQPEPPADRVLLPDTVPAVSLSCDDLATAGAVFNGPWQVKVTGGELRHGVRGKALSGARIDVVGKELVTGREGSIEFWLLPENWNNRTVQNLTFLNGGPEPYFNWYVMNSSCEQRPISLYFQDDDGKNTFVSFDRFIDRQNWHHLVLTWRANRIIAYHNGRAMADQEVKNCRKWVEAVRNNLTFPGVQGDYRTRYDGIRIFRQCLTGDEVWNSFHRYRDLRQLRPVLPYAIRFKPYPGLNQLRVELDILKSERPAAIRLDAVQADQVVLGDVVPVPATALAAETALSLRAVSPGLFTARLVLLDPAGKFIRIVEKELEKKAYPWLGAGLGVAKTVPPPWVPLKEKKKAVSTLLATYDFAEGLIGQITVAGEPLLAAPAQFIGNRDGKPLQFKVKSRVETAKGGLSATVEQTFRDGPCKIEVAGTMDFDGFMLYRLRLTAEDAPVKLDGLRLEIPVLLAAAPDYYALGEHMDHVAGPVSPVAGVFWDSLNCKMFRRHELPEFGAMQRPVSSMTVGNFIPFAWLGGNRRGICFMADNDRGWVQHSATPAVAFRREPDRAVLVLNLVGGAFQLQAGAVREIVFSLMATPTKRPPAGWRHWATDSFYNTTASGRVMDDTMFYVPYPADEAMSQAYFAQPSAKIFLPYSDFYGSDGRMEPAAEFRWEWWPSLKAEEFPRVSQIYRANYTSGSLIDWYLTNFSRWTDRARVNGLYVDNIYPSPLPEVADGPGYRLDDGRIQPGYELLAMRDYFKRLYCLQTQKGKAHPYIMAHMTHCMLGPVMSFVDIAYEGEDHYIQRDRQERDGADSITYWANDIVRIIDQPQTWGVGVHWLEAVHGTEDTWKLPPSREYYVRAWQTQLLLHDSGDAGCRSPVFAQFAKGVDEVAFVLYRDNHEIRVAPAADLFVSYYRRPGAVLAVIGNHAQEDRQVQVLVDLVALKLTGAVITDAESGKPLEGAPGSPRLTVAKRNYRLLSVVSEAKP